ncbi:MAG: hypothetical protein K1X75_01410 [Leptospirales bacterium]|nr:hypothetical protein [Leptospirales bacterium]
MTRRRWQWLAGFAGIVLAAATAFWLWLRLQPPHIVRASFCDDATAEGECLKPWSGVDRVYRPEVPARSLRSWRELGYFMYFHSRETPGLHLAFQRTLSASEKENLHRSLSCSWRLQLRNGASGEGHFEGLRIDSDGGGAWCFDYLGAMLNAVQKKAGQLDRPPDARLFPAELHVAVHSDLPGIAAEMDGQVVVEWSEAR